MKIEEGRNWKQAECRGCGRVFFRAESYKRECPVCYKEQRSYEIYPSDIQIRCLQLEVEKLREKLAANVSQESRTELRLAQQIKTLLFLCHPDKHRGSKRAHEVTQWLLQLRGRTLSTRG